MAVLDFSLGQNEKPVNKTIVRLSTSVWSDRRGIHCRRDITILRKKSEGFCCIEEDCMNVGADEAIKTITNLDDSKDGIYELVIHPGSPDWETGHIEEWNYTLEPIGEEKK